MKGIYKVEMLKLKHSKILYITMLTPIFFVILGVVNFMRYKELFTEKGQNVWVQIYTQSSMFYGLFIMALLITIITAILFRIENSCDSLKRMLTLPVRREKLYLSKLAVACNMIFLNLLVFIIIMLTLGLLVVPHGEKMPMRVIYSPLLCMIASMPVVSVQYYLSMKFKNIYVPLGVGVFFSIPSILINNTKYWMFFPWDYPGRVLLNGGSVQFDFPLYMYGVSIGIFLLFTFIGIWEFKKKDIL